MGKIVSTAAAIVGGVALIATGVGAVFGGAAVLSVFGVSAATLTAAAAVLSVGASLLNKPKQTRMSPANDDRLNISINVRAPRVMALGSTALATDLRDQEFTGADKEYLHRFIVNAAHRLTAIREIWFDDQLAWTSAGGVQGQYAGYLTVQTILQGAPGNAINISARMGSSRRFTGCGYTYLRFKLTGNSKKTESPFAQQVPTRVTIIGDGIPCYDPRQDSTQPGGSGSHRADDQGTWTWGAHARNPACQLATWLLGWRIQNPQALTWKLSVGRGIPADRINWQSFIDGANLCDEPIALAASGTEPRYRGDGLLADDEDPTNIVDAFKACMNADLDDQDGLIRLTVFHNDLAAPDADFTEADVVGDYVWVQTPPLSEGFNVVRGTYVEPAVGSLYQPADYKEASVPSPDGIERVHRADFGLVQSKSQAERLAKQRAQRQQYGGSFRATFLASAWKVQKNSVVRFTFAPEGWTNKLFRVVETGVQQDGLVPMLLREEHADNYAWDKEEGPAVQIADPTSYAPGDAPIPQFLGEIDDSVVNLGVLVAFAQQTADGKATIFYQATPPSASESAENDLWINQADGNRVYRRIAGTGRLAIGGSTITLGGDYILLCWTLADDQRIAQAISNAAGAQATADGKVEAFTMFAASDPVPVGKGVGDLLFRIYLSPVQIDRWTGSAWSPAASYGATPAQAEAIANALTAAENAQATADGKIDTYYAAAAPTGASEGDLWFDTDDGNKLYRHNGATWVAARDTGIADAITAAAGAQATADGRVSTFVGTVAPAANAVGDLWYNPSDGNLKRWDGDSWDIVSTVGATADQVAAISQALTAAENAQATADGKIDTYYAAAAPTGASEGDLWFDTDDGNKLYRHNGATWVAARDTGIADAITAAAGAQATADGRVSTFVGTVAPAANAVGDLWYNPSDGNLKRWDGDSWDIVSTVGATADQVAAISQALTAAENAQATADGKIDTYYAAAAPTAASEGDLWFDTDDGNKLYRHNGATWVAARDTGIAEAITAAAGAQATADGRVSTFVGTVAPAANAIGDLWYNPSDGNLKRWDGDSWDIVSTVGATADQVALLETARAIADGKNKIFRQATPPSAAESQPNDYWINTADGDRSYIRVAGTGRLAIGDSTITLGGNYISLCWTETENARIGQALEQVAAAITAAAAAQATADTAADKLGELDDDGLLTPVEKRELNTLAGQLEGGWSAMDTIAADLGITTERTAAADARTAWLAQLAAIPNLADTSVTSPVDRATYQAALDDYQVKLPALQKKISQEAARRAEWPNVSGPDKPEDGADVTALNQHYLGDVLPISIAADYTGTINAGQLPVVRSYRRFVGQTDVSPDATYAVTATSGLTVAIENTPSSDQRGDVTLSAMTAIKGTITVAATYGGIVQYRQTSVERVDAAPPASGGGGGGGTPGAPASTSSFTAPGSTTTHVDMTPVISVVVGSSGEVDLTASIAFHCATQGAVDPSIEVPTDVYMAAKWLYSATGTSGWSDVGTEQEAQSPAQNYFSVEVPKGVRDYEGSCSVARTKTGLTGGATAYFKMQGRSTGGNITSTVGTGTATPQ